MKKIENRSQRSNSHFLLTALVAISGLIAFSCSHSSDPVDPYALSGTVIITGAAQVGATLTANTDALGGSGTISYQWKREATNIGYDSNTYVVQAADLGSSITVTVTRSDNSGSVTSAPTAVVIGMGAPTPGLAFTLINNGTAYSVSKGTANVPVVVIPPLHEGLPVIEIADSGFASYENLTNIIIPDGVTRIGDHAFFYCGSLISVTIPVAVTRIGNLAFSNCDSLIAIFYGGANSAGWAALTIGSGNTPLTNATRCYYSSTDPDTTDIYWHFVDGIPTIWDIGLAFRLIDDGYWVSRGTASAAIIVIPPVYEGKPVIAIDYNGFSDYTTMTSVTIPNSVTSLDGSAFGYCNGLTSITVGSGNTVYRSEGNCVIRIADNTLILGCKNSMIPNGVTSIGDRAFTRCSSLTSITIPSSVTSIGYSAFYSCDSLTRVFYGGTDGTDWGNISIGNDNSNLTSATRYYYSEVSNAGNYWRYVNGVPEVWDESAIAPGARGLAFTLIDGDTAYKVSRGTAYETAIVIPATYNGLPVTGIAEDGFLLYAITSVTIPNSVTSIGGGAFTYCYDLTSITIPSSVTWIGGGAFTWCYGLTSVTVESGNTVYRSEGNCIIQIADNALILGCKNSVIPNSVTSIGGGAFSGCRGLTGITIPNSVTSIGGGAFSYCYGLTSITIPSGVTSIGSRAFSRCSGLTSITIPSGVTSIGEYAFEDCSGLTSITIPNSVTSIGGGAFASCSGLTSITVASGNTVYRDEGNCVIRITDNALIFGCKNSVIPNSVTSIGDSAFYDCSDLTSITIPNGVTSIGSSAFAGCSGLTSVTIPSGVTSIGNYAFFSCTGLTSIIIPSSVTSIGYDAFRACYGLTRVFYGGANNTAWGNISIGSENSYLTSATRYYYSETNPGPGNYWHYVGGVPTVW